MDDRLDNFARLAVRARESSITISDISIDVFDRLATADPEPARWPIMLVTAGYTVMIGLAVFGAFSAYSQLTHPLLQLFNSVAQTAF